MQDNKTAWAVAIIVIVVVAGLAWWYVASTNPQPAVEPGAPSAPTTQQQQLAPSAPAPVVTPPAPDSTGAIQSDLDAADSGSVDMQKDVDTLGTDIQNGL